jgi:hypothetical protein
VVEADDLAVALVALGASTRRSRAATANGERAERVADRDVLGVRVQRQERFDIGPR